VINVSDRRVVDVTLGWRYFATVNVTESAVDVNSKMHRAGLVTVSRSGSSNCDAELRTAGVTGARRFVQTWIRPVFIGVTSPVGHFHHKSTSRSMGARPTQNNWTIDGATTWTAVPT